MKCFSMQNNGSDYPEADTEILRESVCLSFTIGFDLVDNWAVV